VTVDRSREERQRRLEERSLRIRMSLPASLSFDPGDGGPAHTSDDGELESPHWKAQSRRWRRERNRRGGG
jgi:hypothetical protein